jgi:hypothetical protein
LTRSFVYGHGPENLPFESFVMIKFFPVGNVVAEFVQLLQIADTMGIGLGVAAIQNRNKQASGRSGW